MLVLFRGSLSNLSTGPGPQPYSLSRSHSIDQEQGGGLHLLSRDRESFKGSSSTIDQEFTSTPSPSDSAVGDLENVLKEKDSEIVYLRETMEQNEQVIFKVSRSFGYQNIGICEFEGMMRS